MFWEHNRWQIYNHVDLDQDELPDVANVSGISDNGLLLLRNLSKLEV